MRSDRPHRGWVPVAERFIGGGGAPRPCRTAPVACVRPRNPQSSAPSRVPLNRRGKLPLRDAVVAIFVAEGRDDAPLRPGARRLEPRPARPGQRSDWTSGPARGRPGRVVQPSVGGQIPIQCEGCRPAATRAPRGARPCSAGSGRVGNRAQPRCSDSHSCRKKEEIGAAGQWQW
jgi:hypothetical protein